MAFGKGKKTVKRFDIRGIGILDDNLSYIGDGRGVGAGRRIINVSHEETFQEEGNGAKKDIEFVGNVIGKQVFKVFFVHLAAQAVADDMRNRLERIGAVLFAGVEFRSHHDEKVFGGYRVEIGAKIHRDGNTDGILTRDTVEIFLIDTPDKSGYQILIDAHLIGFADLFQTVEGDFGVNDAQFSGKKRLSAQRAGPVGLILFFVRLPVMVQKTVRPIERGTGNKEIAGIRA